MNMKKEHDGGRTHVQLVHAYFYANNLQIQKIKGEGERDYFNFVYIDADKNAHISHRNSFPKSDTEFVNEFD